MARFMRNRRKKEREGEEKKRRNAIAIIIPFDQETEETSAKFTVLLFRSREEDRRRPRSWTIDSADAWESCGKKMKEEGGGRYGKKKVDENWPGIDRDR